MWANFWTFTAILHLILYPVNADLTFGTFYQKSCNRYEYLSTCARNFFSKKRFTTDGGVADPKLFFTDPDPAL